MGDPAPLPSTVLRYLIPETEPGPKTDNIAAQYLSDNPGRTGESQLSGIPDSTPGVCAAILGKTGPETSSKLRYRSTVPGVQRRPQKAPHHRDV